MKDAVYVTARGKAPIKIWQLVVSGSKQVHGAYSLCVYKRDQLISAGSAKLNNCKIIPYNGH